ncbi:hypothetical protein MJG53_007408 [Ovis ammon polii x Ovis aries]|uniref:Uncharacterized protein n=1 Tax=Ovis ammon polii x Ovis aries TaxID=2918886 RepID=A0ACB9V2Y8_9CETA|nr:hypothetical protein MJG53_007408 [Ovis ammon polii x Ovis aries]
MNQKSSMHGLNLFYKEVSQLEIIFGSPEDIIYKYQEKRNRIVITLKGTTHKMTACRCFDFVNITHINVSPLTPSWQLGLHKVQPIFLIAILEAKLYYLNGCGHTHERMRIMIAEMKARWTNCSLMPIAPPGSELKPFRNKLEAGISRETVATQQGNRACLLYKPKSDSHLLVDQQFRYQN